MSNWRPANEIDRLQMTRELLAQAGQNGRLLKTASQVPAICSDLDATIMRLKRQEGRDAKREPEAG